MSWAPCSWVGFVNTRFVNHGEKLWGLAVLICLVAPKSLYRQVQLHECLGDGCSLYSWLFTCIPGSKQENFSFPGLLLSGCVKTQHPVDEVTWRAGARRYSLRWKAFFLLSYSPSDYELRINNFQTICELRVNKFFLSCVLWRNHRVWGLKWSPGITWRVTEPLSPTKINGNKRASSLPFPALWSADAFAAGESLLKVWGELVLWETHR